RDHSLRRYTMSVVGLDVLLQVDDKDRLLYAEVPSQSAYYVRDGFEALAVKTVDDPLLSAPNHDFEVETNVMVPMRDGVSLATDLYRPHGVEKAPVILIRTPYGKTMQELDGRYYARRGYAVAVQDCRGRFDSEGVWKPFMHEANDGYDSIEYLGVQPWSNGKVGMIGASYVGWVQLWAARDKPPHLVTIIPNVAPPEPFYNIPYEYGSFFLLGAIWWANVLESEATADASGVAMQAVNQAKYARLLQHLPVIELDELLLGKQNVYWREWIEHSSLDEYWAPASFQAALGGLEIPVFHQSGWFDGDGIGSKLNYASIAKGGALQKLVLGPWGHQDKATRQLGDQDFGPEAIVDLPRAYLRWFDHFLKGVDNGIEREPLVSVFVMGSNHWEYAERYPLPQTTMTKLYLDSGGQANSAQGNGVLTWTLPASDSQADQYTYDPADPTPNPGYYVRPEDLDESLDDVKRRLVLDEEKAKAKAQHAKVSAERRDILVYETETLEQPLAFVGPIEAVLYASSSALDTDWVMRLCELSADGEVKALVEGRLRARFRNSMSAPELLEPGKVYEYHLDLWQTGIELPAGSKLRVEVASASVPIFSRNLNTGGHTEMETDYVPAVQTIYHDAERPSHVVLPILTLKTASSVHLELGVP
ncbi:MAG: CocE/NonD family hydrolase, partial [Myxococcota bacterium]|nr:CocE/NonD family hydrolase [Myxococcota bacterium]